MSGEFDRRLVAEATYRGCGLTQVHIFHYYFKSILVFADANGNRSLQLNFPSTKHWLAVLRFVFFFFLPFFLPSL